MFSVLQHDDQGMNTIMKERISIVSSVRLCSTIATRHLRDERLITVREELDLHLELYQRDVVDGEEIQADCAIVLRGHPLEILIFLARMAR